MSRFLLSFFLLVASSVCWLLLRPVTVQAALAQNAYRFYVNVNNITPTDPWPVGATDLGENTPIGINDSGPKPAEVVRIRISLAASTADETSGQTFKLQYGQGSTCSSISTWNDLGAPGSATIWRGFDNTTPVDGTTLPSLKLAPSDVVETYEENNNTASSPNTIAVGQDGEWDWSIEDNGVTQGTTYCFRMVKSDGTTLNSYTDYPKLTTYSYIPKGENWRWYDDENNATPTNPLGPENNKPIGLQDLNVIKLRYTIKETNNFAGSNVKMRLQFTTDSTFATGVTNVVEIGSCTGSSLWCYADGANIADNDPIATRVMTDSSDSATHNESGVSSSTYTHAASTAAEWEFTIKNSGGVSGTVYYFRAFEATGNNLVPLDSGKTYPNIQVFNRILTFTVAGLTSGTTTEGVTTDITTSATTIPFGTLVPNVAKTAAHRLTISADGLGYTLQVLADGQLTTAGAVTISGIGGTNALPIAWGYKISDLAHGIFGYHSGDDTLANSSTRFQTNDTWAALTTTAQEVGYFPSPIENDIIDMIYKVEVSGIQATGTYSNTITYIITPIY